MFAILPRPLPTVQSLSAMPWWAPLAASPALSRCSLRLNGLIIAANIVTSIAIDHFGLLNTPVHTASIWRLIGGERMVGGISLISKF